MKLEVGYLPEKYYNKPPFYGGNPFHVSKNIKYALNIGPMYFPELPNEQLVQFTESLSNYPIYYLIEMYHDVDIYDELQQELLEKQIIFEKIHPSQTSDFFIVTIKNREELTYFIPNMIWQHNYIMSTFWSNNKQTFKFEEKTWEYDEIRDTVCLQFDQPTTVFWLGHDFLGTDLYSNERRFSSFEQVLKLLPDFVTLEIVEFG